jgi:hypothetical protein
MLFVRVLYIPNHATYSHVHFVCMWHAVFPSMLEMEVDPPGSTLVYRVWIFIFLPLNQNLANLHSERTSSTLLRGHFWKWYLQTHLGTILEFTVLGITHFKCNDNIDHLSMVMVVYVCVLGWCTGVVWCSSDPVLLGHFRGVMSPGEPAPDYTDYGPISTKSWPFVSNHLHTHVKDLKHTYVCTWLIENTDDCLLWTCVCMYIRICLFSMFAFCVVENSGRSSQV